MMSIRAFKYASPFFAFFYAFIAFNSRGWLTFLPVIWSYLIIPAAELFIKPNDANMDAAEEEMVKKDRLYDYLFI